MLVIPVSKGKVHSATAQAVAASTVKQHWEAQDWPPHQAQRPIRQAPESKEEVASSYAWKAANESGRTGVKRATSSKVRMLHVWHEA
jgi:hypothetical protein